MISIAVFVAIVLLASVALAALPQKDLNMDVMVEALRQVENWDGHSRGRDGERGPWQITPAVWAEFSEKPFSWAEGRSGFERAEQRRVAREYTFWIHRRLIESRLDLTPYMMALVWGAGWNAVFYRQPHAPSRAKKAYAKRASNLYYDLETHADEVPTWKPAQDPKSTPDAPVTRQRS